jgi:hypothetical protein
MATMTTEPPDLTMRRLVGSKAEVTINDGPYKGQTAVVTSGFGRSQHGGKSVEMLSLSLATGIGSKPIRLEVPLTEVTPVQKPHRPADPSAAAPGPVVPALV